MATPEDTSPQRLGLVGDRRPSPSTAVKSPEAEHAAQQAAAFAALLADGDQTAIADTLEQMSTEQLQTLAIALATHLNAAETAHGEVPDVGPDRMCGIAVGAAAQSFGTTREAILSADRHQTVADARAVAMTAVRRGGMALPAIAEYFSRDHTTVMHAQKKVTNNPRLNTACTRILDRLQAHYERPPHTPPPEGDTTPERRSETLQLAALDHGSGDTARPHDEEHGRRIAVSTTPAR